ncbi:MAG: double zinc ribbon domain-containing protein [Methyloceanibacter sp.]
MLLYHIAHARQRDSTGSRACSACLAVGVRCRGQFAVAAGLHRLRSRISSNRLLCGECFARIDFIAPPICARLGVPLPYDAGEPSLSAAAIASPQSMTGSPRWRGIPRRCAI